MSFENFLSSAGADSGAYVDKVFLENNRHISIDWMRIGDVYPEGKKEPLLPADLSLHDYGQGIHYECFMIATLAALHRTPEVIRHCFVTKEVQPSGRYVFQFFRNKAWVEVVIDDYIAMEEGQVLYIRSPTEKWWPLLLEKAYAKFYTAYDHLEGCTLQEAFHDLTGNPVLNIPTSLKLAKAAGVPVSSGPYWLELAEKINNGTVVASGLTKAIDLAKIGLEKQQQYGIREIFSLTGTSSVKDIVVHLHNQFEEEEYVYKGPLNPLDSAWTPVRRKKYNVDDPRSIFIPLNVFLKIVSTIQVCVLLPRDSQVLYFDDAWTAETAGGNPTRCSFRKNPKYLVRNTSPKEVSYLVSVKQEDQRRNAPADEPTQYLSCGLVLTQYTYPSPIPTEFVTGNNHTQVYRSLFCDVRETASFVTIPATSLCYLIPCCIDAGKESSFTLTCYPMPDMDTSGITIERLSLPQFNWETPGRSMLELLQKEKGRVDFFVDFPSVVHILLRQLKPFTGKNGGDVMAQDYMGIHLYDDTDRRIGGVHASTNFREMSVIHQLPRSGRYAISVTCSRAVDVAKVEVLVVTDVGCKGRIVVAPEDAAELCCVDEDLIMEGEVTSPSKRLTISDTPVAFSRAPLEEQSESVTPYEDKLFFTQNRVTADPWMHLPDLYPEGAKAPLLPTKLSRSHFTPGKRSECCVLSALAALVDREEVIRHCFVSKKVRYDCAYTFQFYRFGEWVKVEVDDRIPVENGEPVFCASPTHHWWPLLLEKAYAKFYILYENLEGLLFPEMVQDFAGIPVLSISTDYETALEQGVNLDRIGTWEQIRERLVSSNAFAVTPKGEDKCPNGYVDDRSYPVLDIRIEGGVKPRKITSSRVETSEEGDWSGKGAAERVKIVLYDASRQEEMEIPLETLLSGFFLIHEALINGLVHPASTFFNEWGEGTNGGYPSLITWRQNPMYLVKNPSNSPIPLVASIQLRDQRHLLHRQTNQNLNYVENQLVLAETKSKDRIPTFLVTRNNHVLHYHDILVSARETVTKLVIPPLSLCYLVPSALYREKFLLSLWFTSVKDRDQLLVTRLQHGTLATTSPAIKHMSISRKEVRRVDIMVDVATDLHILLLQKRVFKNPDGGDVIAEDFFTMELYNDQDQRVAKTGELVNYREVGLVYHAPNAGCYALVIACMPLVADSVPFEIRVVGSEAAHIRITDPPPQAPELGIVDLFFLEEMPDIEPVTKLPLSTDSDFQDALNQLKHFEHYGDRYEKEMKALEERLKDRARHLSKERMNTPPKVDDKGEFMAVNAAEELSDAGSQDPGQSTEGAEKRSCSGRQGSKDSTGIVNDKDDETEREEKAARDRVEESETASSCPPTPPCTPEPGLLDLLPVGGNNKKNQPSNSELQASCTSTSRGGSPPVSSQSQGELPSIMSVAYDGIPTEQLHLLEDPKFESLRQDRAALLKDRTKNAREIYTLGEALQDRAKNVSKQMHIEERAFLSSPIEGIPLDLLPLDDDEQIIAMEAERRKLLQEKLVDAEKNEALEHRLEERAVEIARHLKQAERELFLDPQPLGVPLSELPLDNDPIFQKLEVVRLYKRKEDTEEVEVIQMLEKKLTERVLALAQDYIAGLRSYLDPFPYGIPLAYIDLDNDEKCRALEKQLLACRKYNPSGKEEQEKIQEEIKLLVGKKAALMAEQDRDFLDPEPEGRRLSDVPLLTNEKFLKMDKERRMLRYQERNQQRQYNLEEDMITLARELAHQMNIDDRPKYLKDAYKGIRLAELKLDEDPTFTALEVDRALLLHDTTRNDRVIAETEAALVSRVAELGDVYLSKDRGYLNPNPDDVPLRFLSLGSDPTFGELEEKRMRIKHRSIPAGETTEAKKKEEMTAVEAELNARAVTLAQQLRALERKNFMEPKYLCVPFSFLPLTSDAPFRALEVKRLLGLETRENVEELITELHARAVEIAKEFLWGERTSYLDTAPLGIPIRALPLNEEDVYLRLEEARRDLLQKIHKLREHGESAGKMEEDVRMVEDQLREMAQDFARMKYYQQRESVLNPLPLDDYILDKDPQFSEWERDYYRIEHTQDAETEQSKNRLKELEKEMNARNASLCKELMKSERATYLAPTFCDIPFSDLPLDTDALFESLEWERARKIREAVTELEGEKVDRAGKKELAGSDTGEREVQWLNEKLNARANELATLYALKDRSYLPAAFEGVPLECLPLTSDSTFQALEKERVECLSKGVKSEVVKVEEKLISRANALAMEKLAYEISLLDPTALDIPLGLLDVYNDDAFRSLLLDLVKVRQQGASSEAIQETVQSLNARAIELATVLLHEDRINYLHPETRGSVEGGVLYGIPLQDIAFDNDGPFHSLEVNRVAAKKDSQSSPEKLQQLDEALHQRAKELCLAEVQADYSFLDPLPAGLPIDTLHCHTDEVFFKLINAHRRLRHQGPIPSSRQNTASVDNLSRKMSTGVNIGDISSPLSPTHEEMKVLEEKLNKRLREMAEEKIKLERGYLKETYEGVKTIYLPLQKEERFQSLEKERTKAVTASKTEEEMAEVEERLHALAREQAMQMLTAQQQGVEPKPHGVPIDVLHPMKDEIFKGLVVERVELHGEHALRERDGPEEKANTDPSTPNHQASTTPQTVEKKDTALVCKLNERAAAMADALLRHHRNFLDPLMHDTPVEDLPLDEDVVFHDLEVQRVLLLVSSPDKEGEEIKDKKNEDAETGKHTQEVQQLEDKLKARASELAKQRFEEDFVNVNPRPYGIPLLLLHPLRDGVVKALVHRRREAVKAEDEEGVRTADSGLNERVLTLANEPLQYIYLEFLPPEMDDVPVVLLPIDDDPTFKELRIQRTILMLEDREAHAQRIAALECSMEARLTEMARERKEKELETFSSTYGDYDVRDLNPLEDEEFQSRAYHLRECEVEKKGDEERNAILNSLEQRLVEMAKEKADGPLWFIDRAPEKILREYLPLSRDSVFSTLEEKRKEKKINGESIDEIRKIEQEMNERAKEIAAGIAARDFDGVDLQPHGIPLHLLCVRKDAVVQELLERRHMPEVQEKTNIQAEEEVISALNARVREMALEVLRGRRPEYLDEVISKIPRGDLERKLNHDFIFNGLEEELAVLTLSSPASSTGPPAGEGELTVRLRERADEVAKKMMEEDLLPLASEVESVPITALSPHEDEAFVKLASKARNLRHTLQEKAEDPEKREEDRKALEAIEQEMNARVAEIFKERLQANRDFLDPFPEGVPLEFLPLDTDTEFHTLEKHHWSLTILRGEDGTLPPGVEADVLLLEQHLNCRAHELALIRLEEDFEGLVSSPRGVPLEVLRPHSSFNSVVPQLRQLKIPPAGKNSNQKRLEEVQRDLDRILDEMAEEFLKKDRASYLNSTPDGVPLGLIDLEHDDTFRELERQRFGLMRVSLVHPVIPPPLFAASISSSISGSSNTEDPGVPRSQHALKQQNALQNVEDDLNARAVVLAKAYRERSRAAFLPPFYNNVPLAALRLSDDNIFVEMENKLFAHKARDAERNAVPIRLLEERMRKRATVLAENFTGNELEGVHEYEGIPLSLLCPFQDDVFYGYVVAHRALRDGCRSSSVKNNGTTPPPPGTAEAEIAAIVEKMNERVVTLSREAISGHRKEYLKERPEGIPLSVLLLDEDAAFHQLEVERAIAVLSFAEKNRVEKVEKKLNERASELAKEQVTMDLADLRPTVCGIPTASLQPHLDDRFGQLADERRPLSKESAQYRALTADMNEYLEVFFSEKQVANRSSYIPRRVCGVPQRIIPFSADSPFRKLEGAWMVANQRGEGVTEAASAMVARAEVLAKEVLRKDRPSYLGSKLEDIPLSQLSLDNDVPLAELEVERANVFYLDDPAPDMEQEEEEMREKEKKSSTSPALALVRVRDEAKVKEVEKGLLKRANEIAKAQREKDLETLQTAPLGIPISSLAPHRDTVFSSMLPEWRTARQDPSPNNALIDTYRVNLNKRLDVLAKAYIDAERSFLSRHPQGVPLSILPLESDNTFLEMEAQLRHLRQAALQSAPDGGSHRQTAIKDLQVQMQERCDELAKEILERDRSYLDQNPAGIPLAEIPLDSDKTFLELEEQRLRLIKQEPQDKDSIAAVEEKLNAKARELAAEIKLAERAFLRPTSANIPIELLPLDEDTTFNNLLQQLRRLKHRDSGRTATAVTELQALLQRRADAIGETTLKKDRPAFIDTTLTAPFSIDDLPLDGSPEFTSGELERVLLVLRDPVKSAKEVKAWNGKLNAIAQSLAAILRSKDRDFIDPNPEGIPLADLSLDTDPQMIRLEGYLRLLVKEKPPKEAVVTETKGRIVARVRELAQKVKEEDIHALLEDAYHGILKEELGLHSFDDFREEANRYRACCRMGVENPEALTEACEHLKEMSRLAAVHAAELLKEERGFLDPEPEGMFLEDVPLNGNPDFLAAETERHRRLKDPLSQARNSRVLTALEEKMNALAHECAMEGFRQRRQEVIPAFTEGVSIDALPLDTDVTFREAEVAYYRLQRSLPNSFPTLTEDKTAALQRMLDRVLELALAFLQRDTSFLDQKPAGVPLEKLDLQNDEVYSELARERAHTIVAQQPISVSMGNSWMESPTEPRKERNWDSASGALISCASPSPFPPTPSPSSSRGSPMASSSKLQVLEQSMHQRSCELAKSFLEKRRDYLNPEPQHVPIEDLPLLEDPIFHEKECNELLVAMEDRENNEELIARLQAELNERAEELAWELLRKERAHQNQNPCGVPLWDLPLNDDPELIALERERRAMKTKNQETTNYSEGERADPNHAEVLKRVEDRIAGRVEELAQVFLWEERRGYLDHNPEQVPLEALPLGEDMVFTHMEVARREAVENGLLDKKASLEAALQQRTHELARQHLLQQEQKTKKKKEENVEFEKKEESTKKKEEESKKEEEEEAKKKEEEEQVSNKQSLSAVKEQEVEEVISPLTPKREGPEEEKAEGEQKMAKEVVDHERYSSSFPSAATEKKGEEEEPAETVGASQNNAEMTSNPLPQQNSLEKEMSKIELASFESAESSAKGEAPRIEEKMSEKKEGEKKPEKEAEKTRTAEVEGLSPSEPKEPQKAPFPPSSKVEVSSSDEAKETKETFPITMTTTATKTESTTRTSSTVRDRSFLPSHPRGVALEYLPLDDDAIFLKLEEKREQLLDSHKRNVKEVEDLLCQRVDQLAEDYLKTERDEYIEAEPEGVARETLDLDEDPEFVSMSLDRRALKNSLYPDEEAIKALEEKLLARVSELAKLKKGWQDTEFFEANAPIAEEWPRLRELIPEGLYEPLTPDTTWPVDARGTSGKYGYLAPFIAALASHTGLIDRMFPNRAHPQFNPYVVILFELDGSPTRIEVDDRIPCDAQKIPLFTAASSNVRPRMWYPFLIEKAYAKFVYGYNNYLQFAPGCPSDVFHILTGRPIVQHSLSSPLAYNGKFGFTSTMMGYWRCVMHFIHRGDVLVAQTSEGEKVDGLAPCACYPILSVVDLYPENDDEYEEEEEGMSGIGICLYDCYVDPETRYHGPLLKTQQEDLAKAGLPRRQSFDKYDDDGTIIVIPLFAFLQHFTALFRAVINCGGRYSTDGEWTEETSGGNPTLQTFRKNPTYLVENKCGLPAPLIVEVQHEICESGFYPLTGIALLQSIAPSRLPPTTLFTFTTHRLLYDSGTMNVPQIFVAMDIPPHTTCYMVPYLSSPSLRGKFRVSIYPDIYPVTLTPLLDAGLSSSPLTETLELSPDAKEARMVGFIVSAPCDVHLLVSQVKNKPSNASSRRISTSALNQSLSSIISGNAISVCVLNEYGIKMASSGGGHLLNEISLIFPAPQAGQYTVLAHCDSSSTGGSCTAMVSIYTPKHIASSLVAVEAGMEMQRMGVTSPMPNSPRLVPQRPFGGVPSTLRRGRPHPTHRKRPHSGSPTRGRR